MKKLCTTLAALGLVLSVAPSGFAAEIQTNSNKSVSEQAKVIPHVIGIDWHSFIVSDGGSYLINGETIRLDRDTLVNAQISADTKCDVDIYLKEVNTNKKVFLGTLAVKAGKTKETQNVTAPKGTYKILIEGNAASEGEVALYTH